MPKDCIETINEFLNTCSMKFKDVDLVQLINMDETSIYVDSPSNYTYDKKGKNRIPATTSGNQRT